MAGNLSVEECGNAFASSSRQASANYGVGTDGRIGVYVDETRAAWTSSNPANDNISVTIEVANDVIGGDWHVSDKALQSTINLCVDICKRNGIKELIFNGTASGTLNMHRYFASTLCPGPYLASKFPYIADEVNRKLSGGLTMGQYEELKKMISDINSKLNNLDTRLGKIENKMIYNYIDSNTAKIASDANEALEAAMRKGILKGSEKGLNLTEDMVRIHIFNYRLGLYD